MALDPIVRGCEWEAAFLVDPNVGATPAEVEALMNGATVSAKLYGAGGSLLATGTGAVTSSADRTISVVFTAAQTIGMPAQVGCALDVRMTTTGGKTFAINVRERLDVRNLTAGGRS